MPEIPPEVANACPPPWRVTVNPFGPPKEGDGDNVFVIDADGGAVLIVPNHPVWGYKDKVRLALAQYVVDLVNSE